MEYKHLIFNKSYINGQWVGELSKTFDVTNPATGEIIAKIADAEDNILQESINAANKAFKDWSSETAKERGAIMLKWYNLILENKQTLALIMTLESGKPLSESLGEVDYGSSFIQWFSEEAKRIYGDIIPPYTADRRIAVIKQPVGVVAAITPWNFPLAMITRKTAPALAAGCTVIVRPSRETPLTALAIAKLAEQAGFPPGVFNVVVGTDSSTMGKILCESPKVQKISFTGSTQIGQILMSQSSSTLKKLSLELGGNAPFIIFEDADIEAAVKGAIASKYRNSGQTCVCVNRFLVHEKVYDLFIQKFSEAVSQLKMGNGIDKDVNIGPLINKKAVEKIELFVKDAVEKGGKIITGGHRVKENFFEPTIIANASKEMLFSKEEIFGPLAPIYKFSTDDEAIEMANDTIYGLASYFYSQDINRCWKVSENLEYGMVGINEGLISTETAPFGGVKYSGNGREGSKYGIEDYLEIKYLCFGNVK